MRHGSTVGAGRRAATLVLAGALAGLALTTAGATVAGAATAPFDALAAVRCPSTTYCVAIGDDANTSLAFGETWNGRTWTSEAVPPPKGATYDSLVGLSCTSAANCMAVGSAGADALVERWNGKAWSVVPSPAPAASHSEALNSVSCPLATDCLAVGADGTADAETTLAEQWNGTKWTVVPAPAPAGQTNVFLAAVACSSPKSCSATGGFGVEPMFPDVTILETWNGSRWTIAETIGGDGWFYAFLSGISCPNASSCMAVGSDGETGGGAAVATGDHWNGKTWASATPVSPLERSQLAAVACPSALSCVAVGTESKSESGDPWAPLVERWNGAKWSTVAAPATSFADFLDAVACAGPAMCMAVGSAGGKTGGSANLAEQWNGTHWVIDTTPNP
jgi:hypothetical protein